MASPIRMYGGSDCWIVTARNFQARKLMTPRDPLVREVCGGVLARAAAKYDVKIYAYVFMSNHMHLVIGARGQKVAKFLKYLKGNLSRKLAALCEEPWSGSFWEGRPSVIAILDDEALVEEVRYVAAHGVKEGLVERAEDWEGLHFASQLIDGLPREFLWFDWSGRWRLTTAEKKVQAQKDEAYGGRFDARWGQRETLQLEPLPAWRELGSEERRATAQKFVDTATKLLPRGPPLGMEKVKKKSTEIPVWSKRGPEPLCCCSDAQLRSEFRKKRESFLGAFHAAASEWLRGNLQVLFPDDCFRPFVHNEVQIV
jgi:putative transposase